ncbi:MAG: aspartate-semialdehyde dehydrogenase [Ruminococcus sp.]|nr:aspartate-semialdehyde dehydrogenase [Candidatus Apopatosoma intestinale]
MKHTKFAVMGATGAVGEEMLRVLSEYGVPAENVLALASGRSAGKTLKYGEESLTVRECTKESFRGTEIVLGATEADTASAMEPFIRECGAVFIDNSSAFRLMDGVPLVIPEINGEDALSHRGLIANPNCSTIITLMAIAPLVRLAPAERMVVSTYQAVSGAGRGGMEDLISERSALVRGEAVSPRTFAHPIAENLIPKIGDVGENGYTSEEMKMQNESRKILHAPSLSVTCTCVRVPVMRSHAISVALYFSESFSVSAAKAAYRDFPGVILVDEPEKERYPMPILSGGKNEVFVGRIRKTLDSQNGIALFCSGDQIRKGAAANAVQIAALLCDGKQKRIP